VGDHRTERGKPTPGSWRKACISRVGKWEKSQKRPDEKGHWEGRSESQSWGSEGELSHPQCSRGREQTEKGIMRLLGDRAEGRRVKGAPQRRLRSRSGDSTGLMGRCGRGTSGRSEALFPLRSERK
jgi:hypothetical protein